LADEYASERRVGGRHPDLFAERLQVRGGDKVTFADKNAVEHGRGKWHALEREGSVLI
jgi:hypothetical protein